MQRTLNLFVLSTLFPLLVAAPALAQDTDGDGLTDAEEIALAGGGNCPDPNNADSDGDGLSDGAEVNCGSLSGNCPDPCNADTDDDGLLDDWEINGIPWTDTGGNARRYQICPFVQGEGCSLRKNLYIETDSMQGQNLGDIQTHTLVPALINAPVPNPDGTFGIDVHVHTTDIGLPNATWTFNPGVVDWPPEFTAFKDQYFGSASERADTFNWWVGGVVGGTSGPLRQAKLKAYRYIAFIDQLGSTTVSGVAEQPGNDMIVSLGSWPMAFASLSWRQQAYQGVILHELGHLLNLGHGGWFSSTNFKPNYHSVMNYSWTVPRWVGGVVGSGTSVFSPAVPTGAQAAYGASWMLDYSMTANPPLDEQALSETSTSLCGACGPPHAAHTVPVGPAGPWGWGYLESESAPGIDFDRDFFFPEALVQADINNPVGTCNTQSCDGPIGCIIIDDCPHLGSDDYSNLTFSGPSVNYSNGVHGAVLPQAAEIDFETVKLLSFTGGCAWDTAFELVEPGESLDGHMGWKGWDNDPAFAAPVTQVQARSGSNSVEIEGDADLVHQMCSDEFGAWSFSAWQYIPSDFASGGQGQLAGTWFLLMDQYNDGGPYHGTAQIQFNSNDGLMKVYDGIGAVANPGVPYETDRWVKIQTIIDLEADWTQVYYDDNLVAEYSWTGGVTGSAGGILEIGGVDFLANNSSPVYYDDIRLQPIASECGPPDFFFDADGDELTLLDEIIIGTDPCNPDSDEDGHPDGFDNCPTSFNPDQLDSDMDGIGDECDTDEPEPSCPADLNSDSAVDTIDFLDLLAAWGPNPGHPADLNDDGVVDTLDFLDLLAAWGDCL